MDELITREVLDDEQVEDINYLKDQNIKQSEQLLKTMILISEPINHEKFKDSLMVTNQSHIAKYIVQNGGKAVRFNMV